MKKFSSVQAAKPKPTVENKSLFKGKYLSVVNVDNWEVVEEADSVVIIPYFVEYEEFLLRKEDVPSYKAKTGKDKYLTAISGTLRPGEEPVEALFRELEEETGIRLNTTYSSHKLLGSFFYSKGNLAQCHLYYVPLYVGEFRKFTARGDGSAAENNSTTVRIEAKYIDSLAVADTVTALCLEYLKKELAT